MLLQGTCAHYRTVAVLEVHDACQIQVGRMHVNLSRYWHTHFH